MANSKNKQTKLEKLFDENALVALRNIKVPAEGWIRFVRKKKGLNIVTFAKNSNRNVVAMRELEIREANQQVRLKTLKEVAELLDCKLVYAFVPNDDAPNG